MALTNNERTLASVVDFDEEICRLFKSQTAGEFHRLMRINDHDEFEEADGIAVTQDRNSIVGKIAELQPLILPLGYRAFWTRSTGGDEIAIVKTTDEYAMMRLMRSNGANYGISTEDILEKLESWKELCNFEVLGASGSWVAIQFGTLPDHLCRFAEEIYEFCPDTVDQGVGLQTEADNPELFASARQLCPKLSKEMELRLKNKLARSEAMNLPPQLRAAFQSSPFTTPDMGIRLLAYHLKQTRQLFLWWD